MIRTLSRKLWHLTMRVRVEHVRYVKKPAVDPVSKAIAMARSMGRDDLVRRLER